MSTSVAAGVIFLLTYAALVVFKRLKSRILWGGIAFGLLFGLIHTGDLIGDINWNVMGIFVGTLVLSEFFVISRVPDAISSELIHRSRTVGHAYFAICLFASAISIFIENVATVLIIAPIVIGMSKRTGVSPVPGMIGIAICSNLQGTATLIGDPPSMILANYMRMNFNDFFVHDGRPSIFFAVELGAVGSMLFLYQVFRKYKNPIEFNGRIKIRSYAPTVFIGIMIAALTLSSPIDPEFKWFGGTICMVLAVLCVIFSRFARSEERRWVLQHYDWGTTGFLAGIFVMVGMLERTGVIERFAHFLSGHIGNEPLTAFLIVVWVSVAFSAFIDNVPYLTAMIPAVKILSVNLGITPELLVFGLLIGACLGGNITPVGAAANIVAVGALARHENDISFWRFAKIGLPFTVLATLLGSIFVYVVWR